MWRALRKLYAGREIAKRFSKPISRISAELFRLKHIHTMHGSAISGGSIRRRPSLLVPDRKQSVMMRKKSIMRSNSNTSVGSPHLPHSAFEEQDVSGLSPPVRRPSIATGRGFLRADSGNSAGSGGGGLSIEIMSPMSPGGFSIQRRSSLVSTPISPGGIVRRPSRRRESRSPSPVAGSPRTPGGARRVSMIREASARTLACAESSTTPHPRQVAKPRPIAIPKKTDARIDRLKMLFDVNHPSTRGKKNDISRRSSIATVVLSSMVASDQQQEPFSPMSAKVRRVPAPLLDQTAAKIEMRAGGEAADLEFHTKPRKSLLTNLRKEFHAPADGTGNSDPDGFYTDKALLARESLKFDPLIRKTLARLWKVRGRERGTRARTHSL